MADYFVRRRGCGARVVYYTYVPRRLSSSYSAQDRTGYGFVGAFLADYFVGQRGCGKAGFKGS
ncbi:MAG: hypothetical protein IT292_06950 [Deltaproteobacteria bacterium]|nr:hypothetical protein [Deltaproteobacteria bacterium]